jgi:pimeloyl-ACP methyl ester carboxylesterase
MQTSSRGFTIHYDVAGAGPPLMLVPGTLSSAAHWEMLGYVAALADEFRVLSVDPLGHGASDKPHAPDAYHAAGVTADLVAVLDAEDIERAIVWGYSRGGWLTCGLAASHSERVSGVVLGGFASDAHEAELSIQSAWVKHLGQGDWAGFWRTWGIEDSSPLQPLEVANDPLAVAAAVAGSQRPTRYIDLLRIECPSFHYVGGEDWIAEHVRADAAVLGAPFAMLAGKTHLSAFAEATPALAAVRPHLAAFAQTG